jgi:hypothetical protein
VVLYLISIALSNNQCCATEPAVEGVSNREARMQAIAAIPFKQLNPTTTQALRDVLNNPSFYRRMPTQTIQCDPQLFSFLVRKPEFMVNTWDLMGITKVTAKRTGPYSFLANDGVGTKCKCDLVYGADNIHIYYGNGDYDGSMTARTIKGRAVCILRSENQPFPQGHSGHVVRGTMDVFLKLDNLGADLLTRTLGPLVAKTADHNFAETAQFVAQLSQICANNPPAALGLATQLNSIDESVRQEFTTIASRIGEDSRIVNSNGASVSSNQALMTQSLQELKPQVAINSAKLELTEPAAVPAMQFNLSNGSTSRNNSASASLLNTSGGQSSEGLKLPNPVTGFFSDQPPTRVQPKKSGVTMRR